LRRPTTMIISARARFLWLFTPNGMHAPCQPDRPGLFLLYGKNYIVPAAAAAACLPGNTGCPR
jgi:hypothetical protein